MHAHPDADHELLEYSHQDLPACCKGRGVDTAPHDLRLRSNTQAGSQSHLKHSLGVHVDQLAQLAAYSNLCSAALSTREGTLQY